MSCSALSQCLDDIIGMVPKRTEYPLARSDFSFNHQKPTIRRCLQNPLFFPPHLPFSSEAITSLSSPKAYALTLRGRQYACVKLWNCCGWIMNFVCVWMPSFDLKWLCWTSVIKLLLYQSVSVYCNVGTSSHTDTATGPILKVCRQLYDNTRARLR